MLKKRITAYGQQLTLACDGRCDKAWGRNNRPKLYFMKPGHPPRALRKGEDPVDDDDYVYVADGELGVAPGDPGTSEGRDTKPSATPLKDAELMNRWCFRECERSDSFEPGKRVVIPDLEHPEPNIPKGPES